MFSQKFIVALKINSLPEYRLALASGLNPNLLWKWKAGIQNPKKEDPRLLRLAKLVGVSISDIFEPTKSIETRGQK